MSDPYVCPWWLAPTFDNPLRRWLQNPQRILNDLVQPGQTALDVGCGMGYFSVALAQLVGSTGQVIAVDLQEEMLQRVRWRAAKAGVAERIHTQRCFPQSIGVAGPVDFALAFWMVHETPDQARFLGQVAQALRPGGRFLLVEPFLHVGATAFQKTLATAERVGLKPVGERQVFFSRAMLFEK